MGNWVNSEGIKTLYRPSFLKNADQLYVHLVFTQGTRSWSTPIKQDIAYFILLAVDYFSVINRQDFIILKKILINLDRAFVGTVFK